MPIAAAVSLRVAVHDALAANSQLTSVLGGPKIYDEPPKSAVFPYVTLGEARIADFSSGSEAGEEHQLTLHAWSKLSNLAVQNAFKPIAKILAGDFKDILTGDGDVIKNLTPFASGGIINTPSYFPLSGGLGLAGEAGPEAIVPLSRGADGRLGIASSGGQSGNITVQIMTPDPGSFRRSEAYLTGQIARAVARGQRGL